MKTRLDFGDRAFAAVESKGSCVVVGLDPVWERIPAEVRGEGQGERDEGSVLCRFCCEVVEAAAAFAAAAKPQIAFFERYGPGGLEAFAEVCRFAQAKGLLVIADVKRADIGSTSQAYADAYLGEDGLGRYIDAITVNPYLGGEALRPFFETAKENGKGVFVLVRTSNPGAGEIQDAILSRQEAGGRVFEHVATLVKEWGGEEKGTHGYSHLGAVVGATYPEQARRVRAILPHHWLLVPGYGAQGATALDLEGLFGENGSGVLVNASRSLIYAWERNDLGRHFAETEFRDAIQAATMKMRDEINTVRLSAGDADAGRSATGGGSDRAS